MKIAFFQPAYPETAKQSLETAVIIRDAVLDCPEGTDLLVLPEYSNCPGMDDFEEMQKHCRANNRIFLETVKRNAARSDTAVCLNMLEDDPTGWRNRTYFINKNGEVSTIYDKTHLSPVELDEFGLIPGDAPVFVDFMGATITFAVCFEMYFSEFFERLASGGADLILSPSYQRSETRDVLLHQYAARALDTGAHIARCSFSMGSGSDRGGSSLLCNPEGVFLLDCASETGIFSVDFDPSEKRMRPLAHGRGMVPARDIIEDYRIPSLYRKNSSLRKPVSEFSYPRVCAHRGLSGLVPENTLPAFAAAVSMGTDEIEFDIRLSKDGRMIVCHDHTVDRVSDGAGEVSSLDFDQLRSLNAGHYMGWSDVKFAAPDEIFELFGGRVVMNIHVYETGEDGYSVKQLKKLIDKHDISDWVYFAAQEEEMAYCLKYAPGIERCMLECNDEERDIVDIALEYDCKRVQHQYSENLKDVIKKADDNDIISNLFYEDNPESALEMVGKGIDTILTNYADRIIPVLKKGL